jgi:acetyl esterase
MHDVAAMRVAARERARARPRGPALAVVADIPPGSEVGVAMRLYRPSLDPRRLTVYVHGGGWVIGDLETHDRTCRRLAAAAAAAVLAVDIRNAPEHPWPAAVDDAVAALRFAAAHRDELGGGGMALGVAGDSSGGLVAALACRRLRETGERMPAVQLLAYPNTDLTLSQPSVVSKGEGWGLDARDLRWFADQWVPDLAMRATGAVSPLHADDLAGLPPALIVTAEHDPLRDEGDAYAGPDALAGFLVAFGADIDEPITPGQAAANAARLTALADLAVWDLGGRIVSMAAVTRRTPWSASIGLVYTPPQLRGRGFASAVVAELSQRELDAGVGYCSLLADLANPTSNRIYAAIGYEPKADLRHLTLTW